MKKLRALFQLLVDFVELIMPALSFMGLFSLFVVQIASRYIFRAPIAWTSELIRILFIWTVLLGALYVLRKGSHVAFTLFYDNKSEKGKLFIRLLGNTLILISFLILMKPTIGYVLGMARIRTSVLRIPYNYVYMCFPIFLVFSSVRLGLSIVDDFMRYLDNRFSYPEPKSIDSSLDAIPKNESEQP
jgi:TRAP-type C4-dicarboxylate transport system permease small subunit